MRWPVILSLIAFTGAAYAQDVAITKVTPVGPDGAKAPVLGDASMGVRVYFKVPSATGKAFRVKFEVAGQTSYVTTSGGKGSWNYWWQFGMPLDGPVPYIVTLDPDGAVTDPKRKNNVVSGTFTPTLSKKAVEYYGAQTLAATETQTFHFSQIGGLTSLTTLFGLPETATSQQVVSYEPPAGSNLVPTFPFAQSAYETYLTAVPDDYVQTATFRVQEWNVRVNVGLIKDAWSAFAAAKLPNEVVPYTQPETLVPSTDARIVAYAKANLPANYLTSLKPIQAARRLFLAVVRDTAYKDAASINALDALDSGQADCGGYSTLYAACLRSVGIPARVVCGWRKGADVWHCWNEIYMPSVGWIPQDATDCDSYSPTGAYAYCFACVPDLNARVSVSRATTNHFESPLGTTNCNGTIQVPNYWYWYRGVPTILTREYHATLG